MNAKRGKDRVKSRQRTKARKKLNRLMNSGKLKSHVKKAFSDVKAARYAAGTRKAISIKDDWVEERKSKLENEMDDDIIPLDMIDADIDWENSAFAAKIKRMQEVEKSLERDCDGVELRHFRGDNQDDVEELLPIKVEGKLVQQSWKGAKRAEEDESCLIESTVRVRNTEEEDYSSFSAGELLLKRKELLNSAKIAISNRCHDILADPEGEISKLRELLGFCYGENLHLIVRNSVVPLAASSLAQIFTYIIPGYAIRKPNEVELAQKMKKETKKSLEYERSFLNIYSSYLRFLEKNIQKFSKSKNDSNVINSQRSTKLASVSLKCLSKLLQSAPHFNFADTILDLMIRLAVDGPSTIVQDCCNSVACTFANDLVFRLSAHGTCTIAKIVNEKKCMVPPELLSTFMQLNIKRVNRDVDKTKDVSKLKGKKYKLLKERSSKSKQKYASQLQKLQEDIKEMEATESSSKKDKFATEVMSYVFLTYFRVIKRMPSSCLLGPVLEGLGKFAHLINVDYFGDIIVALECLVKQQRLKLVDSLHCVDVAFVVLSGEGFALNIDPSCFYRLLYGLLPSVPFEKDAESLKRIMSRVLHSLDLMFNVRRKSVSSGRVVGFVKRLLIITFILPANAIIGILLTIRTFLICHPNLLCLVEDSEEQTFSNCANQLIDDPDYFSAQSNSIVNELKILSEYPHPMVVLLARHLLASLPSCGQHRLCSQLTAVKPSDIVSANMFNDDGCLKRYFSDEINALLSKEKKKLNSTNLHEVVSRWIDRKVVSSQFEY